MLCRTTAVAISRRLIRGLDMAALACAWTAVTESLTLPGRVDSPTWRAMCSPIAQSRSFGQSNCELLAEMATIVEGSSSLGLKGCRTSTDHAPFTSTGRSPAYANYHRLSLHHPHPKTPNTFLTLISSPVFTILTSSRQTRP